METGLSKALSYFLRHNPDEGNLDVDEQGFVDVDDLLEAVRAEGWELSREAFIERLDDPDVERFERVETVVRATYGHSIEVDPEYREITPDFPLFHGTSRRAWESIREDGLKPMNRQYVHLSRTLDEAKRVGYRHSESPLILAVSSPPESLEVTFYEAGPIVLAERIPDRMIQLHERI